MTSKADLDEAVRQAPMYDWAHYCLALCNRMLRLDGDEELQRAIGLAKREYHQNVNNFRNAFNLSLYNLVSGRLEAANKLYEAALGLKPPRYAVKEAVDDLVEYQRRIPDEAANKFESWISHCIGGAAIVACDAK